MSDSYQRSYYEVSLTNSQVLSVLAILLLCLLASFVSGMWVAREAGGGPSVRADGPGSGEEVGASGSDERGAFHFFRKLGKGEPEKADDRAEETPAETGGEASPGGGQSSSQQASRAAIERRVSPVEVASGGTPALNVESRPRAATREPQRARTASQRPQIAANGLQPTESNEASRANGANEATDAGGESTGRAGSPPRESASSAKDAAVNDEQRLGEMLVVQVLSSSDQAKAGEVVVQLKGAGYRAFLSPTQVEGRTMYRVRVGPYTGRAQAEQASEKIKRRFRLDTWITARG